MDEGRHISPVKLLEKCFLFQALDELAREELAALEIEEQRFDARVKDALIAEPEDFKRKVKIGKCTVTVQTVSVDNAVSLVMAALRAKVIAL